MRSGTVALTNQALTACTDRRSLPTQVHVRPSNINCNSLRSEFSDSMCNQRVLIGNWNEQKEFDKVMSVDPNPKAKGANFRKTESFFHDRICPSTMGGVPPRYQTESREMSRWLPKKLDVLPGLDTIKNPLGKPLHNEPMPEMYHTAASDIGQTVRVRF